MEVEGTGKEMGEGDQGMRTELGGVGTCLLLFQLALSESWLF